MRKTFFALLVVVLATGLVFAGAGKAHEKATGNVHRVTAELVSVDAAAKTITIKTEKGEMTTPVMGKALGQLASLKPGERITCTCKDNDKGEHEGIIAIHPAKAHKK